MSKFAYKLVEVPTTFQATAGKGNTTAIDQYEAFVNRHADHGWELVQVDNVTEIVPTGCFRVPTPRVVKVLIFKQPK